MGSTDIS